MDNFSQIPCSCNHFGVGTNNGQTFILEFSFQEAPVPGQGSNVNQNVKTFSRVAIDRIGMERLLSVIKKSLEETENKKI